MEVVEFDKKIMLSGAYPIGMGKSSICFATSKDEVFKIFRKSILGSKILSDKTFPQKIERISTLTNESFIGPQKLLKTNNEFVGYTYPFINAPTLSALDDSTTIGSLLSGYPKLMINAKKLSEQHFELRGLHSKSMLFDGEFYVIDLDHGVFKDEESIEELYDTNTNLLFTTIIKSIYDIGPIHNLVFDDKDLNLVFHHMDKKNMEDIEELKKILSYKCSTPDPTLRDIKQKVKAKGKI